RNYMGKSLKYKVGPKTFALTRTRVECWPMFTAHRTRIAMAVLLLGRSGCVAQSNDVFSFFTSASTPLSGYRVAVVSASPIWVVGAAQNKFGIEECSYWTDSAGRAIPWAANIERQPGDKQHRYTRFRFGQISVSLPLAPIAIAVLAGLATM